MAGVSSGPTRSGDPCSRGRRELLEKDLSHAAFAPNAPPNLFAGTHAKFSGLRISDKPIRVLVVEDEALIAMNLSALIKDLGGAEVFVQAGRRDDPHQRHTAR